MKWVLLILLLIIIIVILNKKKDHFNDTILLDDTIYGKFTCFSEDRHICNSIRNSKSWELSLSQEIEKHYKPNTLFIDVGANYGTHSIYIANKIKNENGKTKSQISIIIFGIRDYFLYFRLI